MLANISDGEVTMARYKRSTKRSFAKFDQFMRDMRNKEDEMYARAEEEMEDDEDEEDDEPIDWDEEDWDDEDEEMLEEMALEDDEYEWPVERMEEESPKTMATFSRMEAHTMAVSVDDDTSWLSEEPKQGPRVKVVGTKFPPKDVKPEPEGNKVADVSLELRKVLAEMAAHGKIPSISKLDARDRDILSNVIVDLLSHRSGPLGKIRQREDLMRAIEQGLVSTSTARRMLDLDEEPAVEEEIAPIEEEDSFDPSRTHRQARAALGFHLLRSPVPIRRWMEGRGPDLREEVQKRARRTLLDYVRGAAHSRPRAGRLYQSD